MFDIRSLQPNQRDFAVEAYLLKLKDANWERFKQIAFDTTGRALMRCMDVPDGDDWILYEITEYQILDYEDDQQKELIMEMAQGMIEKDFEIDWSELDQMVDFDSDLEAVGKMISFEETLETIREMIDSLTE